MLNICFRSAFFFLSSDRYSECLILFLMFLLLRFEYFVTTLIFHNSSHENEYIMLSFYLVRSKQKLVHHDDLRSSIGKM